MIIARDSKNILCFKISSSIEYAFGMLSWFDIGSDTATDSGKKQSYGSENVTIINSGVGGKGSDYGVENFSVYVEQHTPDISL